MKYGVRKFGLSM